MRRRQASPRSSTSIRRQPGHCRPRANTDLPVSAATSNHNGRPGRGSTLQQQRNFKDAVAGDRRQRKARAAALRPRAAQKAVVPADNHGGRGAEKSELSLRGCFQAQVLQGAAFLEARHSPLILEIFSGIKGTG